MTLALELTASSIDSFRKDRPGDEREIGCVSLLIDNGATLVEANLAANAEADTLHQMWQALEPTDLIIGHGVRTGPLPLIRQRSWLNGVRPSRRIDLSADTHEIADTLELWNPNSDSALPLDDLAMRFDLRRSWANPEQVELWRATRNVEALRHHTRDQARRIYEIFGRMMFLDLGRRIAMLEDDVDLSPTAQVQPTRGIILPFPRSFF